jgi:hypothetical protein
MNSKHQSPVARFFLLLERPVAGFFFAFLIYFFLSTLTGNPFRLRELAYFNYLADAFLHGQTYLRVLPPVTLHDLSFFDGKYYLYWPPMPAIVLMPFVAIFGINFSDMFFSVVVASVNVALIATLLRAVDRAGLIRIEDEIRGMLVCFFAFGTAHVTIAFLGQVWYTAQLLGILFVGSAYLSAIELKRTNAFLVTGTLMGCAMLTRNHLLFTGVWPAYYLISKHWDERSKLVQYIILGILPAFVMGLCFLGYNYARFGDPLELGIQYHNMDAFFVADYQKYGAFNLHYVPINFYYQYIHYPFPFDDKTAMGSSLFLLSPVFFYAFRGLWRGFREPAILALLVSVLITSIPILLLMGTGWIQYGPRYTLDFTVPLLLLTASGLQGISKRLLLWLVVISILQYIPGVFLYINMGL